MWNRAPSTGTVQCYHRSAEVTQPLTNHLKSSSAPPTGGPKRPPTPARPRSAASRPRVRAPVSALRRGPPPSDDPARNPTVSAAGPDGRRRDGRRRSSRPTPLSPTLAAPAPGRPDRSPAGLRPRLRLPRRGTPGRAPLRGRDRRRSVAPTLPRLPSRGARRRAPPRGGRRRRPLHPRLRRSADPRTDGRPPPAPLRHPPAPAEAGPRHRAHRLAGECDCGLVEMAGSAVRVRRRPRRLAGECESAGSRRPGLAARSRRGRTRRRLSRTIRRAPVRAAASAAAA